MKSSIVLPMLIPAKLMNLFQKIFIAVGCILFSSMSVQAAPFFTNKEGNLIFDKATGLVWMRCSVGQDWDGATCTGAVRKFNIVEAKELAINGWRLPIIGELASLIHCSNGKTEKTRESIAYKCSGPYVRPTINTTAFPSVSHFSFWSATKYEAGSYLQVDFSNGDIHYWSPLDRDAVRLVRVAQLSGNEVLNFPVSMEESTGIVKSKRQAEERRAQEQRSVAERSLVAGGVQSLYLLAGQAQRNGSVTEGGISFHATELYEMIVEKFPKSDYAVKAMDQLTAMSRSSHEQSAARSADFNSKQRAYEACRIEMNSCNMRTNGKGNCWRDCERLR